MIRRLRGEIAAICDGAVVVDVGGIGYEVLVAAPLWEVLADRGPGGRVELAIYHAEGGGPGGSAPRLIGFASETERSFFELLLTVPYLGPVAAIKALVLPVATIAKAIETGDAKTLQMLPGVGRQRARDIISKLQGRVSRFLEDEEPMCEVTPADVLTLEALAMLTQIGLGRADALARIRAVREAQPQLERADEIVRAVFRRR